MGTSIELLDRALEKLHPITQRQLSERLGFMPTTLGTARTRQRLSPTIAGMLAHELGEDIVHWIAIAALEAEKPCKARDTLLRDSKNWRKR